MNAPVTPRRSRWRRILLWATAAFLASWVVVAVGALSLVRLTRDAATLREALTAGSSRDVHARVQISAGPATLAFARMVVSCIDDVPPEAREALRAIRSASVGVYDIEAASAGGSRNERLGAADRRMAARGWTRIVGVRDGRDDLVAVYLPAAASTAHRQRFCVAVCRSGQLVVVAGTADVDALVRLAERHRERIVL